MAQTHRSRRVVSIGRDCLCQFVFGAMPRAVAGVVVTVGQRSRPASAGSGAGREPRWRGHAADRGPSAA
eukprot:5828655-Alexandrium_andersonii.AAC.1